MMPLQQHRDLLIMDNRFVAETVLTPDWEPIRAEATIDDGQLRLARQYLRDVLGAVDDHYIVKMSDEEVKSIYGQNTSLRQPIRNAEDVVSSLFRG
jgi:hypothetical protein